MPLPQTLPRLERQCLADIAYARLRGWILDGTLAAGEALRDESLAAALGMSRTPVREALQRLENEGLVLTSAARRTYVSPVSLKQAREIYPIVSTLESMAARGALGAMNAAALRRMRAANDRLAEALRAGDAQAATEADMAVHSAFIARCGNDELARLLTEMKSKVIRLEHAFWGAADRSPSVRDHDELIDAFARGDIDAALAVLARNWERGLAWVTTGHE